VLYILGNAGETVFDKMLLKQMEGRNVTCVARKNPILLAATIEDAKAAGIDAVRLIHPGADMPRNSA